MRIEREHTAALIIDYQERTMPVMADREEFLRHSGILIRGLKLMGVPMIVTQQYTKGLGKTIPEITEAVGTEEYQEKISFSALSVTEPLIREKKYILVCGSEAHVCVLQTVIDLAAAGYVPVLVTDCIASRAPFNVKLAMKRAEQEGAILTTSEAILFELLKEAGTPLSKAVIQTLK